MVFGKFKIESAKIMNCIAADDEPLALELLVSNISKVPFLNLIATCSDAYEAQKVLTTQKIDLVFIDIQMPGLSGLELIRKLENPPLIILITAYKQYALDGHELAVVDYLIKPVALERFIKACQRAKDLHDLKTLITNSNEVNKPKYFFVNADYSQVKVVYDDIIWLEGLGDYIKFHLRSLGKPLVVRISFKQLENELPKEAFVRIHKSAMVNIAAVTALRKNSLFLGEIELPIGETYRVTVEKNFSAK